jgi:CDP-glycerol glycerophosphotransferase
VPFVSGVISVVVPAYNVAAYLDPCLESLAQQTISELDVLVVDDGSTDESRAIAERFAARDARFRLLSQPNAGQGAARNNGVTQASGDFLAFVDGDDVVPRRAYEALLGTLKRTRSDFATGKVRRLTSLGTSRVAFLEGTFDRERLETHITRFPGLTADRLACNKLFRRSFWTRHALRFPEGVRNEDIPTMMRAHYLAERVDVLAQTVYWWRRREGGDLSGSQRRFGIRALRDRIAAIDDVSRFLAGRGMNQAKIAYDRSVVANDLRYFLGALDTASDEERELFLDGANDFLDRADPQVLDQPLAIERLKWHLVRRRALPELMEVLRFQTEEMRERPPVKGLRHFYGDYPYRSVRALRIPRRIYRLDEELSPVAKVNDVRWDGECLRIEGYAYIEMLGAATRRSQRVDVVARSSGPEPRTLRFRTEAVCRPDVTADADHPYAALDWSGFVATLAVDRLKRRGHWQKGPWTIGVVIHARGTVRESWQLEPAPLHALRTVELGLADVHLRAGVTARGELALRVQRKPAVVGSYAVAEGVLTLEGETAASLGAELTIGVRRRDGAAALEYAVDVARAGEGSTFATHVPLAELVSESEIADEVSHSRELGEGIVWDFELVGERRRRIALEEAAPERAWTFDGREFAVQRTRSGTFALAERSFRPVVDGAEWSPAGILTLSGSFHAPQGEYGLLVRNRRTGEAHTFTVDYDAEAARFAVEVNAGHLHSLAGARPLAEGRWELLVTTTGPARAPVQAIAGRALLDSLPLSATIAGKRVRVGVRDADALLLDATRDLDDAERGSYPQRRLRVDFYRARRCEALRDVVLYECFGGREYSDNPRAIHEELVRRGAPFEHLWIVRDGRCNVPETAVAVRELSRDYYDAYARARYVVANDYWPRFAARRPEQMWLQTWHGSPLKLLGDQLARRPKAVYEYRRFAGQSAENWDYVVSPGPWATSTLQRAFPASSVILEQGLPRTDVLMRADRDELAADVRRCLGLPADRRVVLYAPTYRDHLRSGDTYRLGPILDLAAVRSALERDAVVLFRRHPRVVGALPLSGADVHDVSDFPDATELLLAVDVLVTDYSSATFDFAALKRPILFFTPDLETYRDEIRGLSIDLEREAPGPLLRTTGEVIDALRDPDAVWAAFRERYERFAQTYCALNDGGSASRVVERVFHS